MKKLIVALFFALAVVAVGPAYAADEFDRNPDRYHAQGINNDGNASFIDKSSIRHHQGDLTTYTGIMRLSNLSELFGKAKALTSATQVPLYVVSFITVDCVGARLKTGRIAIVGVDTADEKPIMKILWSDATSSSEWGIIPNGIEPIAKGLLCGPSF